MRPALVTAMLIMACLTHAASSTPAMAECKRLAFAVNDYGKKGPARDAKKLLVPYIAKWMAKRKIKKYTIGPKHVTCKLFLNFIVFDEYTCTAEANACWGNSLAKPAEAAEPAIGQPAE